LTELISSDDIIKAKAKLDEVEALIAELDKRRDDLRSVVDSLSTRVLLNRRPA
jgi:hypothetical protein